MIRPRETVNAVFFFWRIYCGDWHKLLVCTNSSYLQHTWYVFSLDPLGYPVVPFICTVLHTSTNHHQQIERPNDPCKLEQEALVAFTGAQRFESSTDETLEDIERIKGLIASKEEAGVADNNTALPPISMMPAFPGSLPSVLPEVDEEDEAVGDGGVAAAAEAARINAERKAAAARVAEEEARRATEAAVEATAAAAALVSTPSPRTRNVPSAIAMGRSSEDASNVDGGAAAARAGAGGEKRAPERDSDSMSIDSSVSTQAVISVRFRWEINSWWRWP